MRIWAGNLLGVLVGLLAMVSTAHAAGRTVPVPRNVIYPGDPITDEGLVDRAFDPRSFGRLAVIDNRQILLGKVARRTLLPGQPIDAAAVREPFLIKQGRAATIVYESGGLSITSQAMALQSGSSGEIVAMQNLDSGTIVRGTVRPDGTVNVGEK